MIEEWRPVVGFEGSYEVSDLGRMRSPNGFLSTGTHKGGYALLHLYKNGRRKCTTVHHEMLRAFVGPCPRGQQGCHNDGNSQHNVLSNLRWDTPVSNAKDKREHGTHRAGEQHSGAKLTQIDVLAISASAEPQAALASRFGVTFSNISAIQRRKSWRHV